MKNVCKKCGRDTFKFSTQKARLGAPSGLTGQADKYIKKKGKLWFSPFTKTQRGTLECANCGHTIKITFKMK